MHIPEQNIHQQHKQSIWKKIKYGRPEQKQKTWSCKNLLQKHKHTEN